MAIKGALTAFISYLCEAVMPDNEVPPSKLNSALSVVSGASYGSLIGAGLAATLTIVFAPAIAIPAIVTILGAGAGAALGYAHRPSASSQEERPVH